ncbi:Meiotically up-regulated protein [Vanrija pseudolonga]|uniref:Meiotically up-regulated protein n=1 Tax=Vanrija pseudolonga TaxID=143232 RepID=A0AAF1BI57_9TREE|nr:Meiotically up-regulated protein [Vanrija pseudolonga]
MSQSPLAPARGRKSLSAFARPPSQLSRSHSTRDLEESPEPPSPSPLTPSKAANREKRRDSAVFDRRESSRRESNVFDRRESNIFATPKQRDTSPARYKSTGVGGDSTPTQGLPTGLLHTPTRTPARLIHSPFAYTPPTSLSRSSTIPFDMAGNARAAKKAEVEARLRAEADAMPKQPKQRLVRRKSLFKRAFESPMNLIDAAIFNIPTSVEEILPPARFANPIALFLGTVHWLLLAPLSSGRTEEATILRSTPYNRVDDRWGRYDEEKPARRGLAGARLAATVTVLLFALSVANAAWLFTRFRTYDMQLRSGNDPVPSPNASPIPSPTKAGVPAEEKEEHVAERDDAPRNETFTAKCARIALRSLVIFLKWSYHALLSTFGFRQPATSARGGNNDRIQSLRVWDPPDFCLAFFCALPPSTPIIAYLLTTLHPFITPLLSVATAFLLSHLAASFAQLVKDRMLLSAEVMREYDRRFVYKRVFASMVDRGVGTTSDRGLLGYVLDNQE